MKLSEILLGLEEIKVKGNIDIEITGIENNSKLIKNGYVFVAINGYVEDGHKYVLSAIEQGAKVIVIENIDS